MNTDETVAGVTAITIATNAQKKAFAKKSLNTTSANPRLWELATDEFIWLLADIVATKSDGDKFKLVPQPEDQDLFGGFFSTFDQETYKYVTLLGGQLVKQAYVKVNCQYPIKLSDSFTVERLTKAYPVDTKSYQNWAEAIAADMPRRVVSVINEVEE